MAMQVNSSEGQLLVLSSLCGDCDAGLLMPWIDDHYEIRCRDDPEHRSLKGKRHATRALYDGPTKTWREYDIMTQQPTAIVMGERNLPQTMEGMVDRGTLAKWPQDLTKEDKLALAQVALAYHLDFLQDELIPYHGKPYVTIKGRRRLDEISGHKFTAITWRPLTDAEKEWYGAAHAIGEGDLDGFAVGTLEDGSVFEGFGKVTKAERGSGKSPVVASNPIEMFRNRSERRLREIAFGPVQRMAGLLDIPVLEEGDETVYVEGSVNVSAPPKEPPKEPEQPEIPQEGIDFDSLVPIPQVIHSMTHFVEILRTRGWDLERFQQEVLRQNIAAFLKAHTLSEAADLFRKALARETATA